MARRRQRSQILAGASAVILLLFIGCCCGPCAMLLRNDRETVDDRGNVSGASVRKPQDNFPPKIKETNQTIKSGSAEKKAPSAIIELEVNTPKPTTPSKEMEIPVTVFPEPVVIEAKPKEREWKSGTFSTQATFAGIVDGSVRLTKSDGQTINVPITKLSSMDRGYVKDLIKVDAQAIVTVVKVKGVISGDTLLVVDEDGNSLEVRLVGIDAPEIGQAFSESAKEALGKKVLNKKPWVEWRQQDESGRLLGNVYFDGRWINLEMVAEGHSWYYQQGNRESRLANAESIARAKRLGLWKGMNPVAPWFYRKNSVR